MFRFLAPLVAASAAFAAGPVYELSGKLVPRSAASVSLFGTTFPFSASTLADVTGQFHFKKLQPGLYTVAVFTRRRGEARRTVEVGPALADRKRRVAVTLEFREADWVLAPALGRHTVAAQQLAVPPRAFNEYREAQNDLSRHDVDAAVKRLEHVVELAPQFSAAWNNLGTIAYQTANYLRAEECFRAAVEQDPQSFEALVNLGGILVTLHKLDEAMEYNLQAVLARPNDALANSQLGTTYYLLGQPGLAAKYLERTRQVDPAHFSYPQILLSEIYFRRGEKGAAAEVLEDFLKQHPDWPQADKMRKTIAGLRETSGR